MDGARMSRDFRHPAPVLLCLGLAAWVAGLCGLLPLSAFGVSTNFWVSGAGNGNWANTDGSGINNWYRGSDAWNVRREDLQDGQWQASAAKTHNIVEFGNGDQTSMTVNDEGGAKHFIHQIWFKDSASRTLSQGGSAFISLGGGSGNAKIEAFSGSGTGTYTFDVPISLEKTTELNPVGGNLTFNDPNHARGRSRA